MTAASTPMLSDDQAAMLVRALPPALGKRDRTEIVAILWRLVDGRAPLGLRWIGMAQVLIETGELDLAARALELLIAATPGDGNSAFAAATMFAAMGRPARARRLVEGISSAALHPAQRAHFLGTAASELGDAPAAERWLTTALDHAPDSGQVWHALAVTHRFETGNPLIARLDAALSRPAGPDAQDRGLLHYARGKARDDLGDVDGAFSDFAAGADLIGSVRPFDIAADIADIDATIAAWTPDAMASLIGPDVGESPIIILGLPRSGTTLVEQILASHSAVGGGGENDVLRHALSGLGNATPAELAAFSPDARRAKARLHLHLLRQRFGSDGLLIDKALGNLRFAGLLAILFPAARFLLVRRDPRDTAWSIFRTYFTVGQDWSWSLDQIARHMRGQERLASHWRVLLGERLHIVDYDALTLDPATEIRAMLTHCGLAFEPATLEPHKAQRAVTTASVTQVRAPIGRNAVGSADRYAAHLAAFDEAYRRAATRVSTDGAPPKAR